MEISLNLLDAAVVSGMGIVCFLAGMIVAMAYTCYLAERWRD